MSKYVFLYKIWNSDDRDCVKYVESNPSGTIGLHGACFSCGFDREDFDYDDIVTLLTRKDFELIFHYNSEIKRLKDCDDCENRKQLQELIKPVLDKLNSEGNRMLFEKVVEEEMEAIQYEFSLTDDEIIDIFDRYCQDYQDRAIVSNIYESVKVCGYEYAYACGYIQDHTERYFDFEKLGYDLLDNEDYYELPDGQVVRYNY